MCIFLKERSHTFQGILQEVYDVEKGTKQYIGGPLRNKSNTPHIHYLEIHFKMGLLFAFYIFPHNILIFNLCNE